VAIQRQKALPWPNKPLSNISSRACAKSVNLRLLTIGRFGKKGRPKPPFVLLEQFDESGREADDCEDETDAADDPSLRRQLAFDPLFAS
jgi:hypothetical protein